MLGDTASALSELGRITGAHRLDPVVLELEWEIRSKSGEWAMAFDIGERLVQAAPERVGGWVLRAYAARRMPGGGLDCAWSMLHPAAERFPRDFLIPYNLSCYAAQLGRLDEAWQWFQRATDLGGKAVVLGMARTDPDLEPIRNRLRGEERASGTETPD